MIGASNLRPECNGRSNYSGYGKRHSGSSLKANSTNYGKTKTFGQRYENAVKRSVSTAKAASSNTRGTTVRSNGYTKSSSTAKSTYSRPTSNTTKNSSYSNSRGNPVKSN